MTSIECDQKNLFVIFFGNLVRSEHHCRMQNKEIRHVQGNVAVNVYLPRKIQIYGNPVLDKKGLNFSAAFV
jgi:hypothetical protein